MCFFLFLSLSFTFNFQYLLIYWVLSIKSMCDQINSFNIRHLYTELFDWGQKKTET